MVTGYCVKCKKSREMKGAKQVKLKNGRPAVSGTCHYLWNKNVQDWQDGLVFQAHFSLSLSQEKEMEYYSTPILFPIFLLRICFRLSMPSLLCVFQSTKKSPRMENLDRAFWIMCPLFVLLNDA